MNVFDSIFMIRFIANYSTCAFVLYVKNHHLNTLKNFTIFVQILTLKHEWLSMDYIVMACHFVNVPKSPFAIHVWLQ
jgi:hypothetical protein